MTKINRKGPYRVTRNCCTSGNCFHCRGITPVGVCRRIVHASGYSRQYAERVAANWKSYQAMFELDLRA